MCPSTASLPQRAPAHCTAPSGTCCSPRGAGGGSSGAAEYGNPPASQAPAAQTGGDPHPRCKSDHAVPDREHSIGSPLQPELPGYQELPHPTPKRNPALISSHSPLPPSHRPQKPLTYFLSLWIYLFWTFLTNRIIQYVAFGVWLLSLSMMLSRFIHVVAGVRTSLLLLNNVLLCG